MSEKQTETDKRKVKRIYVGDIKLKLHTTDDNCLNIQKNFLKVFYFLQAFQRKKKINEIWLFPFYAAPHNSHYKLNCDACI